MKKESYLKIKTVADAVKACGENPKTAMPDVSKMDPARADYILAHTELMYVVEAVNIKDGKKYSPDFTGKEWHYEPYHGIEVKGKDGKLVPSGVGFSSSLCDVWCSNSSVGARLSFRDTARLYYTLKEFESLYLRTKLILTLAELKKLRDGVNPTAKKKTVKKTKK